MSAILEECIGFGGSDSNNSNERHMPPTDIDPSSISINIDPPIPELNIPDLKTAIEETKAIRAANKTIPQSKNSLSEESITDKKIKESKKIIETFREKTAAYPKYISYEGAMVLCVLLSMKVEARIHITNLPLEDQKIIRGLLPEHIAKKLDYFNVKFDKEKDFILHQFPNEPDVIITLFNAVAHPRMEDLNDIGSGIVPIKDNGDKFAMGGLVIDKKTIQKIMKVESKKDAALTEEIDNFPKRQRETSFEETEAFSRRQPVAGRNAYEIRADVLQMAIDWSSKTNEKSRTDDEVVALAKKFYSFVENRR